MDGGERERLRGGGGGVEGERMEDVKVVIDSLWW